MNQFTNTNNKVAISRESMLIKAIESEIHTRLKKAADELIADLSKQFENTFKNRLQAEATKIIGEVAVFVMQNPSLNQTEIKFILPTEEVPMTIKKTSDTSPA